ncbi:MAG: pseudouridine synthase, partial [Acidimicrobiales bacterium]
MNGTAPPALQGPLRLTVPAVLDGERVDRALALLAGISRAQASHLVSEGRARVGGVVVSAGSRKLRGGEVLELERPPGANAGPEKAGGVAGKSLAPRARLVFVDDDIVVVDKPAGLVVHPGAGNPRGTLVDQLVETFPDIASAGPDKDRPGIVHRLDKGTSGLLVVARNPAAREGLAKQMAAHSAERAYLGLAHGEIEADEGIIEAPLGRSPT